MQALSIKKYVEDLNSTNYSSAVYNINWTSLAGDDYKYNVTICDLVGLCNSTTTRTISLITSQSNISLNSGWNLIALPMANQDAGTNRTINLNEGWNLIGYTGAVNTSLSNAVFNNGTSSYAWPTAVANNKVQAYMAYYDNPVNDNESTFKYLSTLSDFDDSVFRQDKGYWVYSNEAGNLTIPSIGGTTAGQSYSYLKIRFSNGTQELSINDAYTNKWISDYINYLDINTGEFVYVCSVTGALAQDPDKCLTTYLEPQKGYFINSLKDNITLIRQN